MPTKIPPSSTINVSFEIRFNPNLKAGEPHFAQITALLKGLDNDGLDVFAQPRLPVLVAGRAESVDECFERPFVQLARRARGGGQHRRVSRRRAQPAPASCRSGW